MDNPLFERLRDDACAFRPIDRAAAFRCVTDDALPLQTLVEIAAIPRHHFFGRKVQIHIINNIRNGLCPEDCGYCAQRKTATEEIPTYAMKSEEEVMKEAENAYASGAYRYCLVSSGRGPNGNGVARLANIIRAIKTRFPSLKICLSAGILKDHALAQTLKDAGLDRYNHNLNTAEDRYDEICSTHTFADRIATLKTVTDVGISPCSGVIVGMGETASDLVDVAAALADLRIPSIPVNFFLPVPGHAVTAPHTLTPEYCLRVLIMFRLVNPSAEIRMAAGREVHLQHLQRKALLVANSCFVAGYLNVRGSDADTTIRMIREEGYEIDAAASGTVEATGSPLSISSTETTTKAAISMKSIGDLRPFLNARNRA